MVYSRGSARACACCCEDERQRDKRREEKDLRREQKEKDGAQMRFVRYRWNLGGYVDDY